MPRNVDRAMQLALQEYTGNGHSTIYESGVSPIASLIVAAFPLATLTTYTYPSSARLGWNVALGAVIRNDGGSGDVYAVWVDLDTGAAIAIAQVRTLAGGASTTFTLTATMPSKDWKLQLRYGHVEYGDFIQDGAVSFMVQLLVAMALTLMFIPTTAIPSETVKWNGTLKRVDTGAGVGGQLVDLQSGPTWTTVATATTGIDGSFSGTFTAPGPGTYEYQAYFAGYTSLTAVLGVTGVPYVEPWKLVVIILSAIGGGVGIYYVSKKGGKG